MKKIISLIASSASLLLSACAAIPPGSDYVSCSGSSKYKVCERVKICGPGESVMIKDHFYGDELAKSVEQPCSDTD